MPRRSKGARLWLEPARRDAKGRIIRRAVYVIRDGSIKRSTGFGEGEIEKAQRALADYHIARYSAPRDPDRDPGKYQNRGRNFNLRRGCRCQSTRGPERRRAGLSQLLEYFGDRDLLLRQQANLWNLCRLNRGSEAAARRELEDLAGSDPIPLGKRVLHGVNAGRSS